ncbi:hypothetical protein DCAR_0104454 [Daucus carota subsp. sativus]|uniref:Uncharacterized protein n=1 Tax=Daucus carota subsp. sativus TaxID=79200 RepID=A0AAF0W9F3_DAUCS|nr:PREDICTED: (R)-limonene synthase 1-like [Daucus carota subsp. sativus]WOG85266.1 hypothetical protein DCAR_0104454 [Daucus carota subsp. sativus]
MANVLAISTPFISCNLNRLTPRKHNNVMACKSVIKSVSGTTRVSVPPEPVVRRSANYKPCLYDDKFLQSMKNDYTGESYKARASELKEEVRAIFNSLVEPLEQLELIDHLQRLGLAYHFEEEINRSLKTIHCQTNEGNQENGLHETALKFRLLRQHGLYTSPEGFKRFTENDSFSKEITADIKGLLSLYEATYFSIEGESLMEDAFHFTNKSLRQCLKNISDLDLQMQVTNALELPLQWRIPRFDARWYIDLYQRSPEMIPAVLEFSKLDFNFMQEFNQKELKDLSRWWSKLGMGEKLPFARDRLVASFFWSLGICGDRKDAYCLEQCTKIIELIGVYDDVYDVYGTLDELELFTDVVERWDLKAAMKELPDYMKLCFLSLYNFVNETSYDILLEQNIDVLQHQRKWWMDLLLKRYIVEARWYHGGYQPTLEEHLRNGFVSSAGPIVGLYSYMTSANPIQEDVMEFVVELPDIVRLAYEIFRLSDDYGTGSAESKRGDVPSTLHCYMSETGVTEEVARKHMMDLMRKKWAQVNKCRFSGDISPLSWHVVDLLLNLVRVSHWLYNAGDDGFGAEDVVAESTLFSLVVNPIPL